MSKGSVYSGKEICHWVINSEKRRLNFSIIQTHIKMPLFLCSQDYLRDTWFSMRKQPGHLLTSAVSSLWEISLGNSAVNNFLLWEEFLDFPRTDLGGCRSGKFVLLGARSTCTRGRSWKPEPQGREWPRLVARKLSFVEHRPPKIFAV